LPPATLGSSPAHHAAHGGDCPAPPALRRFAEAPAPRTGDADPRSGRRGTAANAAFAVNACAKLSWHPVGQSSPRAPPHVYLVASSPGAEPTLGYPSPIACEIPRSIPASTPRRRRLRLPANPRGRVLTYVSPSPSRPALALAGPACHALESGHCRNAPARLTAGSGRGRETGFATPPRISFSFNRRDCRKEGL
jgi:hypothetical protein